MKRMAESDYEDKCSQWADDVRRMSNREKRKVSPRKGKRIGANRNTWIGPSVVGTYVETL